MKHSMLVKALVGLMFNLPMSGCLYLAVERDGEFFPSTRDIWNARQKYWLPPTAGGWVCCFGAVTPYVGPLIFYPPGFALHLVEGCVIAPAYDIVCMPYDLCRRPTYLAECRRREEACQAEKFVRKNLDAALDDGRYLSPSHTVYHKALSEMLSKAEHDALTTGQVSRIVAAIQSDESLLLDMRDVSRQAMMKDDDREWFIQKAIELRHGGRGEDGNAVAAAVCRSRKLSDAQYDELVGAGFSAGMVASSKRVRESYNKRLAEEAAKEAARRKAEEERQTRICAIEEKARREAAERIRREEEKKKFELMRQGHIDSITGAPDSFKASLVNYDDEVVRKGWIGVVKHLPLRPIPAENLMVLLRKAETSTNFWSSTLRHAILERPEIPVPVLEQEYEWMAEGKMTTVSHVLKNPNCPASLLEKAYSDPRILGYRMQVAINPAFPWEKKGDRDEFMRRAQKLIGDKCNGMMTEGELDDALLRLLDEMQPSKMPAQWRDVL